MTKNQVNKFDDFSSMTQEAFVSHSYILVAMVTKTILNRSKFARKCVDIVSEQKNLHMHAMQLRDASNTSQIRLL